MYRGVLPVGQVIAVKQYNPASYQDDHEFCSELEVLSCAQYRNAVIPIGLSVDDKRSLLVDGCICNWLLDHDLYNSFLYL